VDKIQNNQDSNTSPTFSDLAMDCVIIILSHLVFEYSDLKNRLNVLYGRKNRERPSIMYKHFRQPIQTFLVHHPPNAIGSSVTVVLKSVIVDCDEPPSKLTINNSPQTSDMENFIKLIENKPDMVYNLSIETADIQSVIVNNQCTRIETMGKTHFWVQPRIDENNKLNHIETDENRGSVRDLLSCPLPCLKYFSSSTMTRIACSLHNLTTNLKDLYLFVSSLYELSKCVVFLSNNRHLLVDCSINIELLFPPLKNTKTIKYISTIGSFGLDVCLKFEKIKVPFDVGVNPADRFPRWWF
jgi:hypothetical protein